MFKYFLTDIRRKKWLFLFYIAIYSVVMIGTVVVMILIMKNYCNQSSKNPAWNIYSVSSEAGFQNETYNLLKKDIIKKFKNNMVGISGSGQIKFDNKNYICSYFEYSDINKFYSSKNKSGEGEAISSGKLYDCKKRNIILEDASGLRKGKLKIIDNTDLILSGDLKSNVDLVLSVEDFNFFCNEISQLNIEFCNHLDTIQLIKLKKICKRYGVALSYQKIWKWSKIIANRNYLILFLITLLYAVLSVLFIKSYIISSQKRNFNIYFICGANPTKLKNIFFYIFTIAEIFAWVIGIIIVMLINCIIDLTIDLLPQFIICIVYGLIVWLISLPWIGNAIKRITLRKGK